MYLLIKKEGIMSRKKIVLIFLGAALGLLFSSVSWPTPPTKPDLKVTELTAEQKPNLTIPLRLEITVHIKNTGAATGAVHFVTRLSYRMHSSDPWQQLQDWSSGALGANGGAVYTKTFDFTEGGTYYFKAEVDANNEVAESAEGNNTKTLTKTFQAGTSDLIVKNLVATSLHTSASGSMSVKAEWDVENIGDGKASGSFVTVLYVSKNGGSYSEVQRYTRSNLNSNGTLHFSKTSSYTNFNSLRFKVTTDETHTIEEKLEGNNTAFSNTITR
jgi:hypothetical protein